MAADEASLGGLFQQLSLSGKSAFSLDKLGKDYVLDAATQTCVTDNPYLAATSSNNTIRLFSRTTLAAFGVIKGHEKVITGVCWGKSDPNILLSCSQDRSMRCWDIRAKMDREVQKFEGHDVTDNHFTCLDINAADRVICAGQEAKGDDVYLLFWDRRGCELLGCYSESHQDDITRVCFHPTDPDKLASGSTDCLVCLFDLSESCEDDALTYTLHSGSTVANLGWCGEGYQNVYCTTHIDTLHTWDSVEGDQLLDLTDLKKQLKGGNSIDYIVDCLPSSTSDMYFLAGKHNGDLSIVSVVDSKTSIKCKLTGGHTSTVRCAHWDSKSETLVTGAEDSLLCLWSTKGGNSKSPSLSTKGKFKTKPKPARGRRKNPY